MLRSRSFSSGYVFMDTYWILLLHLLHVFCAVILVGWAHRLLTQVAKWVTHCWWKWESGTSSWKSSSSRISNSSELTGLGLDRLTKDEVSPSLDWPPPTMAVVPAVEVTAPALRVSARLHFSNLASISRILRSTLGSSWENLTPLYPPLALAYLFKNKLLYSESCCQKPHMFLPQVFISLIFGLSIL